MDRTNINKWKAYLKGLSYNFTEEWLPACIDWIYENHSQVTDEIIKRELCEQWRDTNLDDMGTKCLPENLAQQRYVTLPSKYCLQVNSIQDIGESAYNQWHKIKKSENENASVAATDSTTYKPSWEPKAKRCLFLKVTDGSQLISAMELIPIPSLSLNLRPGCKIVVYGPVSCRHGVLHLKSENLKVIGGEVEELCSSNSSEAILAKILNINPSDGSNATSSNPISNSARSTQICTTNEPSTQSTHVNSTAPAPFEDSTDIFDDDELFMEIDEDAILASVDLDSIASNQSAPSSSHSLHSASTVPVRNSYGASSGSENITLTRPCPALSADLDDDFFDDMVASSRPFLCNRETESTAPQSIVTNRVRPQAQLSKKRQPTRKAVPRKSDSDDSTASSTTVIGTSADNGKKDSKQLKIDSYLRPMPVIIDPPTPVKEAAKRAKKSEEIIDLCEPTVSISNLTEQQKAASSVSKVLTSAVSLLEDTVAEYPIPMSNEPFMFLQEVHDRWHELSRTKEVVYVKACIATLVSNLKVEKKEWALNVCLNDGSAFLNAKLSSDLLMQLIGFSPAEMKKMKAGGQDSRNKVSEAVNALTSKLVNTNCLISVEIGDDAIVKGFREIMLHHISALELQLNQLR